MIIGIVGEGKMGSGIFNYLLNYPVKRRWIGSRDMDSEKSWNNLEKKIRRAIKSGIMEPSLGDRVLRETIISRDIKNLADCDLVIEAIPENQALKRILFQSMDAIVGATCILATNSSSILPSELWIRESRYPLIVGMHFFYPIALKSTVEVMVTSLTEPGVIDTISQFLVAIRKKPLILNERNGFILNRLLLDVQNEAWHIIEQKMASEEQIDRLVTAHLFPFGLFSLINSVGIETTRTSVENYTKSYPHVDYYQGFIDRLKVLEREGKQGMKTGNSSALVPPLSSTVEQEILDHLRNTWLSSCKRFTMQSGCMLNEMNDAIKDYFDLDKGPFE